MIPHSRPSLGPKETAAAARVIRSGKIAQGLEVAGFETQASRLLGLKSAAAVSSGTKALELALRAMGAGPGHEVLIPSYVCSALWHAVRSAGAEPVLVDSEEGGVNACMKDAARRRTRRTRAVIVAHLFGEPADLAGAEKLGVPILEDCAQSVGARWRGRPLGSIGRACALSFYATKLLTCGEGGLIASSDARLVERARDLRDYDERVPDRERGNAKLTDIQAAIGRVQLSRLAGFLAARSRLALRYGRALRGLGLGLPGQSEGRVWYRYVVAVPGGRLGALADALERRGVTARRPVFRPLHLDVACRGKFPNAERAWAQRLSLPLYPSLSAAEQERVIAAVAAAKVL